MKASNNSPKNNDRFIKKNSTFEVQDNVINNTSLALSQHQFYICSSAPGPGFPLANIVLNDFLERWFFTSQ